MVAVLKFLIILSFVSEVSRDGGALSHSWFFSLPPWGTSLSEPRDSTPYMACPSPPLFCNHCCPLPKVATKSLGDRLSVLSTGMERVRMGPPSHDILGRASAAIHLQGWPRQLGQSLLPTLAGGTNAFQGRDHDPLGHPASDLRWEPADCGKGSMVSLTQWDL